MSHLARFALALVICCSSCVVLGAAGPNHRGGAPTLCGWNIVPTPNAAPHANFRGAAATSGSDIWAVGSQTDFGLTLIEHFDGSSWSVVPSPNVGTGTNVLSAVAAVSPSDAWAVGGATSASSTTALIEHFDGNVWKVVDAANPSGTQFAGVTELGRNDVWAVGIQCCAAGLRPAVQHFNGNRWFSHYIGHPGDFPELVAVSGDSSTDVWAVGDTNVLNAKRVEKNVTLVEHWDGLQWRRVGAVDPDDVDRFLSVKANAQNDVWAVGFGRSNTNRRFAHALVEHWDGVRWSVIPNPAGSGPLSIFYSVSSTGPTDAWAVGEISAENPLLTEHWDGSTWSMVYAPGQAAPFNASVDLGPNDVWAFGASDANQTLAENYCIPVPNGDERLNTYRIPPINGMKSDAREIALDQNNTAWFTDLANSAVGHIDRRGNIVEYPLSVGSSPLGIASGRDGNMWAAEGQGNRIAKIAPNGSVAEIALPFGTCPQYIASASDGALWFTECQSAALGRMTTSGTFSSFSIPFVANRIAAAQDGTLWFTNTFTGATIGRYSIATGTTTVYTLSGEAPGATGVAISGDQSAWIGESNAGKIARISTAGVITEFPDPNGAAPFDLTFGGDGNIWFTNRAGDQVGSITPDGTYTIYVPGHGPNALYGIAGRTGDNSIWFVENLTARIGRVADIR